jgi:hypothetical protein
MKRHSKDGHGIVIPDLQTQYEELLDTVWRCEARKRVEDRAEAWARFEELQRKRWARRE